MKFKTAQADEAYAELLRETGRIVQDVEQQARDLPVEARVHLIIEVSKVRLSGHTQAILTAAQIDSLHAGLMIGAGVALSQRS